MEGKFWGSAGSSYKGVVILTALKLHGRHLTFLFSLHNFYSTIFTFFFNFVLVFIRHFVLFILDSALKHLILSQIAMIQENFGLIFHVLNTSHLLA